MAEQLKVTGQNRCRFLACKEMFFKETAGGALPESESGYYWCLLTQTLQGPDGKLVGREECGERRNCHQKA
jgi:hypothetical protein